MIRKDAAYIYLSYPIKDNQAKNTIEFNENIIIDFDDDGKMLGVEILDTSKVLPKKSISEAKLV